MWEGDTCGNATGRVLTCFGSWVSGFGFRVSGLGSGRVQELREYIADMDKR